jgi:hypothetical protein
MQIPRDAALALPSLFSDQRECLIHNVVRKVHARPSHAFYQRSRERHKAAPFGGQHEAQRTAYWNADRCRASPRCQVVDDRLGAWTRLRPGEHRRFAGAQIPCLNERWCRFVRNHPNPGSLIQCLHGRISRAAPAKLTVHRCGDDNRRTGDL